MFRFRLQPLLRLRIAERDERRADLAKALRAEALLEQQRQRLAGDQAALAERARQLKSPGTADVDGLLQAHRYEVVLGAQARQLEAQIAQVAAEAERRRQALLEADRQVRVVEKLRERQAAAHRQHEERLAVKEMDEVASVGYARKEVLP
jgi:flagellar FliJ protein